MPATTKNSPPAADGKALSDAERKQAFIAALQRDLNRFLSTLGATERLTVDGVWDPMTRRVFEQACRVFGLAPEPNVRTFRLISSGVAEPTAEELQRRVTDGAIFAANLRAQFALQHRSPAAVLAPDEVKRAYIAALQRDLNTHLRRLRTGIALPIDGTWDPQTDRAFKQVCTVLGIEPEIKARTFRIIAGATVVRTPREATRAAKRGEAYAQQLKAEGVPTRFVLGGRSLPKEERDRAYTAFLQRTLNDHLVRLGSPGILAVDGRWGKDTQRVFAQVCRGLGLRPDRTMATTRAIAGALTKHVAYDPAVEQQLRAELERMPRPALKPSHEPAKPHTPSRQGMSDLAKRIAKGGGGRYTAEIIEASRKTGTPVAWICALAEQESTFSNVFGHDKVPHEFVGGPVTKERYLAYKQVRGSRPQGVGPMQLTTISYQDRADELGGCWVPAHNFVVGAQVIQEKLQVGNGTVRDGFRAYNGDGPDARAYAELMMTRIARWEAILGTKRAAGNEPAATSTKVTFRASTDRIYSAEVERFQRIINRRYENWKVPNRIGEDGKFGEGTAQAAAEVASGMGIARADFAHGFTPQVRRVIAHPAQRTARQKERAAARGAYRKCLRAKYKSPRATATASTLNGKPAPKSAALMKIIGRAAEHGLIVTSTTGGRHATTSWHHKGLAVDFGVDRSRVSAAEHQRRMRAFQREMVEDAPQLLELFGPIRELGVKNGSRIVIPAAIWQTHQDHVHVAAE